MTTLFANESCPYVQRVLIGRRIRQLSDATLPIMWIDFFNPPREIVDINPDWTVPTIGFAPGRGFDDSALILEFMDSLPGAGPKLFGSSPVEAASQRFLVRRLQWQLIAPIRESVFTFGNRVRAAEAHTRLLNGYVFAETLLAKHERFFGGNHLVAADVVLAPFLLQLKAIHAIDANTPVPPVNSRLTRYIADLIEHPDVCGACPSVDKLQEGLAVYQSAPAVVLTLAGADRRVLSESDIIRELNRLNTNVLWKLEHDEQSFFLRVEQGFTDSAQAVRTVKALHALQEASNHHCGSELQNLKKLILTLRTHRPSPGVTLADIHFVQALQKLVFSNIKYGEEALSPFL
jgi:glutathione S-transferase/pterin-4a-carbinolamine dehydratase